MDITEFRWGDVDWIDLTEDRDQLDGSCKDSNEPTGSIKCWEILE
jgi:hypothetical protein